ncbi:MAG: hypothetical protein ACK4FZ_14405 [Vogesella sp.]|uniref:hypothetical protein n=1 Tax=Vogesella sp. TaxID=1904252 RepID=UPI00391CC38A
MANLLLFSVSFAVLILAYVAVRPKGEGILPIDFFVVFFTLQYGIHAGYPGGMLRLSAGLGAGVEENYLLLLSVSYIGLALGLIQPFRIVTPGSLVLKEYVLAPRKYIYLGLVFSFLIAMTQFPDFSVYREYMKYVFGSSDFSYVQLRREVFQGDFFTTITNLLRQSATVSLFLVGLLFFVLGKHSAALAMAVLVFFACAAQLNKFPYVYYVLSAVILVMTIKGHGRLMAEYDFKKVAIIFTFVLFLFFLLSRLYIFQYSEELAGGLVTSQDISNVLPYRLFFASNDGLRLWVDYFSITPFIGFANIQSLADFFGLDYFNPPAEIPYHYLGVELTTIQVGFIGSSYASFGLVGVFLNSLIIAVMVREFSAFVISIRQYEIKALFLTVFSINMIFLQTREFHTALVSGGVLIAPLFMYFIIRLISERKE